MQAGANTRVVGTLNAMPNTTYVLDFYDNPTADPSGYGQGQYYLGATTVTTDVNGNVSFDVTFNVANNPGDAIAATATNPDGSTSEFSAVAYAGTSPLIARRVPDQAARSLPAQFAIGVDVHTIQGFAVDVPMQASQTRAAPPTAPAEPRNARACEDRHVLDAFFQLPENHSGHSSSAARLSLRHRPGRKADQPGWVLRDEAWNL